MFCRNCGTELIENSKFCVECGTKAYALENIKIVRKQDKNLPEITNNSDRQMIAEVKLTEEKNRNNKKRKSKFVFCLLGAVCIGLLLVPGLSLPKSIVGKWTLTNTGVLDIETTYDGNNFIDVGDDIKYKELEFNESGACRMGGENGVRRNYFIDGNSIVLHSVLSTEMYEYELSGFELILTETDGKERAFTYMPSYVYDIIGAVDAVDVLIIILWTVPFVFLFIVLFYSVCVVLYEKFEKKQA